MAKVEGAAQNALKVRRNIGLDDALKAKLKQAVAFKEQLAQEDGKHKNIAEE